jgi:hypothetical protein
LRKRSAVLVVKHKVIRARKTRAERSKCFGWTRRRPRVYAVSMISKRARTAQQEVLKRLWR